MIVGPGIQRHPFFFDGNSSEYEEWRRKIYGEETVSPH
jgi:hypothetical protein